MGVSKNEARQSGNETLESAAMASQTLESAAMASQTTSGERLRQVNAGEYADRLHADLTYWISDSPTRSGFGVDLDRCAACLYAAVLSLRAESAGKQAKRLRADLLKAIEDGLGARLGYTLTKRERELLRELALAVVTGTTRKADLHGVHGLRVCRTCCVVFETAARASECPACGSSHPRESETRDDLENRRHTRALFVRAFENLAENALTEKEGRADPSSRRCPWCKSAFVPVNGNQRYCPGRRCSSAAYRARKRAAAS